MNLLDQLVNFGRNSVSINLLDSPPKGENNNSRGTRHCSVFASHKHHETRQTKSIEKLQTWMPTNKQQIKQRILFKLARTLQKKARRFYSQFWLNCEQAIKNSKTNGQIQNISLGMQKIICFVQAYNARYSQGPGLSQAFSKLSKFYTMKTITLYIENSIDPAIKRQQKAFLEAFHSNQKNSLKMDLFMDSMDIIINKFKSQSFNLISHYSLNKPEIVIAQNNIQITQQQNQQGSTEQAKRVLISTKKIKKPKVNISVEPFDVSFPPQYNEVIVKTFAKIQLDKVIQSCSETCDNSLLFIERPKQIQNKSFDQQQQRQIFKIQQPSYSLTKRNLPKIQTKSQLFDSGVSKNEINLMQTQLTMKKQYSTPRNRSISSSSIFNVDQTRIQKLQKKLFGQSSKKQSRFSVNGEDWKNDRKALVQIISNIKSPERLRRNSAYEVQLQNVRGKVQMYNQESERKKLKNYALQDCQSPNSNRDKNKILLKALLGQQNTTEKLKNEPKIVVSIKSKKKEDPGSLNNLSARQKCRPNQQQNKRIGIACQR